MKKIAIMQPYFFPYIGYFQLFREVDEFVIYDKIKYTKKGWINRNRILTPNGVEYITLPIKNDSDFLYVYERNLSDSWEKEKTKLINKLKNSYVKSPFFKEHFPIILECLNQNEKNLFNYVFGSIKIINNFLDLKTPIIKYSELCIDDSLKSQNKVIEICKNVNSTVYINPIGGTSLYSKDEFQKENIELRFLKSDYIKYPQSGDLFFENLSIVDMMMYNSLDKIKENLKKYTLI